MAKSSKSCIFCDIVAGRAPARIVQENEFSFAVLDINPLSSGHCLVLPKRHVPWWHQMTEAETESLFKLARAVSRKIMRAYRPDMVTMYVRGRRIPHAHIFLVPTFAGDLTDRHFNALEAFQESPPKLTRLREKRELDRALRALKEK